MTKFLLVLRGPAGSGKTTLAKAVQAYFNSQVAHLRQDLFQWKICPQDENKEQDQNPLVYKNLGDLAKNYLEAGYSVILDGTLNKMEEFGLEKTLTKIIKQSEVRYVRIYLQVDPETAKSRQQQEADSVPTTQPPTEEIRMSQKDNLVETSNREPTAVLQEVLELIQ